MNHADILNIAELDCFRILCLLDKKDICNAEVARILNLNKTTVRGWKRGRSPVDPHSRRLVALFKLYYPDAEVPSCVPRKELASI